MIEPTFTNDPAKVTKVVWYVASDAMCFESEDEVPSAREKMILDRIAEAAQTLYPNADVYVANGGFENQFAPMSPRGDTDDDSIYEPFFDDMTTIEQNALTEAFNAYPEEGEEEG